MAKNRKPQGMPRIKNGDFVGKKSDIKINPQPPLDKGLMKKNADIREEKIQERLEPNKEKKALVMAGKPPTAESKGKIRQFVEKIKATFSRKEKTEPQQQQQSLQQQGQHKGSAQTPPKSNAESMLEKLNHVVADTEKPVKAVAEKSVKVAKSSGAKILEGFGKTIKTGVKEASKTVSKAPQVVKSIKIKR